MTDRAEKGRPVGQGEYVVKPGDCISSIAAASGHFWQTLWHDPANAELKSARVDPNVLLPGDRLTIRPIAPKSVVCATAARHRFRRRGIPAYLRLRLLFDDDRPRVAQPFTLTVDGHTTQGVTDDDGRIEVPIPPGAKRGSIKVGPDDQVFELALGELAPSATLEGVKGRLRNLGYDVGATDGRPSDKTTAALRRFQQDYGCETTGEPDAATLAKLLDVHGS